MNRNEFYTSLEKWIKSVFTLTKSEQYKVLAYSESLPVMDYTEARRLVINKIVAVLEECKCNELVFNGKC